MEQTIRANLNKLKEEIDNTYFKNQLNDFLNPTA